MGAVHCVFCLQDNGGIPNDDLASIAQKLTEVTNSKAATQDSVSKGGSGRKRNVSFALPGVESPSTEDVSHNNPNKMDSTPSQQETVIEVQESNKEEQKSEKKEDEDQESVDSGLPAEPNKPDDDGDNQTKIDIS